MLLAAPTPLCKADLHLIMHCWVHMCAFIYETLMIMNNIVQVDVLQLSGIHNITCRKDTAGSWLTTSSCSNKRCIETLMPMV